MYSPSEESKAQPPPDAGKYVRLGLIALIGIVIVALAGGQAVELFMDVEEFRDLFTTPLYYYILSGVILSAIALVRVNAAGRSSITWYAISTAISFLKRSGQEQSVTANIPRFRDYKLSLPNFAVWQVTKVLLFAAFFSNLMFGFAAEHVLQGNDLGMDSLVNLFSLPFVTPPTDPSYAEELVIPMIPSLVMLIPALLAAVGTRLLLYIGLHNIIKVVTDYLDDASNGKPRFLEYIAILEFIIGVGVLWGAFNMFFVNQIDYNTRYAIGGALAAGFALIVFYFLDKYRAKVITHPLKRDVYIRVATLLAIGIIAGSVMAVNNSIADAKKVEYLGPYKAQQIGVNRHLANLDTIQENFYNLNVTSVPANEIPNYVQQNNEILNQVRVWDWEAAFAKLKPEIGLIPYVDFEDNDILRFNNTLYWTASMKPIIPSSVTIQDRWYNEHLVYTHVPNGFLTLDATKGSIVDSSNLFNQRTIYYGEGGLFEQTWSAYPANRGDNTAELNDAKYDGEGGITINPPMSWIFEPNFLLSFPSEPIHVMRYKDLNSRMQHIYPYFLYNLFGKELDTLPVANKDSTNWLIPLIVGFDASHVPWTAGNPYLRLSGYAMMDAYDADVSLIKTGDDFFTSMFEDQYKAEFRDTPNWLKDQFRYPVELFTWKTEMYNIYHVTDEETFIQAKEFYEVPRGLDTYYIMAQPPGFEESKYIGLLSLELRGSQGRNLAGYMTVENNFEDLGRMQFYEVPIEAKTKLIGPTAVREALDRDPDFAQLKTLLRNPRIGDNILYQIGNHDVYFIPVYTAGSGGVVAQLGTIAAVGAAFEGDYHVGLGDSPTQAFSAYLAEVAGSAKAASQEAVAESGLLLNRDARIQTLKEMFQEEDLNIITPTSIQAPLTFEEGKASFFQQVDLDPTEKLVAEFIDDFVKPRSDRIMMWQTENRVNFGTIVVVQGVPELHYISVDIGK